MLRSLATDDHRSPVSGFEGWVPDKTKPLAFKTSPMFQVAKKNRLINDVLADDKDAGELASVSAPVIPIRRKASEVQSKLGDKRPYLQVQSFRSALLDFNPLYEPLSPQGVVPRLNIKPEDSSAPLKGKRKSKTSLVLPQNDKQTLKEQKLKENAGEKKAIRDIVRNFYKNNKLFADKYCSLRLDTGDNSHRDRKDFGIRTGKAPMIGYAQMKERSSRRSSLDPGEGRQASKESGPTSRVQTKRNEDSPRVFIKKNLKAKPGIREVLASSSERDGGALFKKLEERSLRNIGKKPEETVKIGGTVICFRQNSKRYQVESPSVKSHKRVVSHTDHLKMVNPLVPPQTTPTSNLKIRSNADLHSASYGINSFPQMLQGFQSRKSKPKGTFQIADLEDQRDRLVRMKCQIPINKSKLPAEEFRIRDSLSLHHQLSPKLRVNLHPIN